MESQLTGALGKVGGILSDVLEPALKIVYGRSLEARTQVPFSRPGIYGGGTANAQGGYHLACNLKNETLVDVAKDAWNALRK